MADRGRSLLDALRPKPFRGDTVAAGAVVLATLVVLLDVRQGWAEGVDLALVAVALAFVATLAVSAPVEGHDPRVYQTVLFVTTLILLGALLERLGEETAIAVAWKAGVVGLAATWFARRRGSGTCALVAAIASGVALLALADELGAGTTAARRILLALTAVYALSAVVVRDRRPRAAAMLAVAGGTATLAIAGTFLLDAVPALLFGVLDDLERPDPGTGWLLLLLGTGFGLCALSGVERQPGPGYVGVLNLVAFVALAADDGSLLGWPLLLAIAAAALLAAGLRPSTPLPPPPDAGLQPAEPLPLRPR